MFKEKETTSEEIIELVRKSHVEDKSGMEEKDIDTGIILIDYEMIELEQRKLLDGKVSMCMPLNIFQMEEEFAFTCNLHKENGNQVKMIKICAE